PPLDRRTCPVRSLANPRCWRQEPYRDTLPPPLGRPRGAPRRAPPPHARAREPPPRGTALRHRGGGRGTGGMEGLPPVSQRRRRLPGGDEKRVLPRVRRRGRGSDPSSERSLNATHASRAPAQAAPSSPPFTLRHPRTLRETS